VNAASDSGRAATGADAGSRREFLASVAASVGIAFGLGALAFRFLEYLYPVVPPIKWIEVPAGKLSEIPPDGVRFVSLPEGPVLLERAGGEIRALSAICTHLGCIVQWHPKARKFICPCHHGTYNFDGAVLSGPPPRPLVKLQAQTRGQEVFVRMKSLKEEKV
jgi:cytochrome b6-f complex iron-sulfur subunit